MTSEAKTECGRTVRGVLGPAFPRIVCLCGSTRFKADFEAAAKRETLAGRIVLTVGFFGHCESTPLGHDVKQRLDDLHLRKIDLADEVLVLNVGGYVGESTGNELAYALGGSPLKRATRPGEKKSVRTLEPMDLEAWTKERDERMRRAAAKNLKSDSGRCAGGGPNEA